MEEKKQSPENIDDEYLEKRVKGFNGELLPLLGKYKLGLGAVPFLLPDGRISARPHLFDDSKAKPPKDAPVAAQGAPQNPQDKPKPPVDPVIPA